MTDVDLDLEGIRARAEAATPGPWRVEIEPWTGRHRLMAGEAIVAMEPVETVVGGPWGVRPGPTAPNTAADFAFLAHARDDLLALVAAVERLRTANP